MRLKLCIFFFFLFKYIFIINLKTMSRARGSAFKSIIKLRTGIIFNYFDFRIISSLCFFFSLHIVNICTFGRVHISLLISFFGISASVLIFYVIFLLFLSFLCNYCFFFFSRDGIIKVFFFWNTCDRETRIGGVLTRLIV